MLLLLTVLVTASLFPASALADVNNFTVTNFTADYYLTRNDPQGQMRVVEQINADFTDQNHGILRAIPQNYKGLPLNITISKISSATGAPVQYTTSTDYNDNDVLKIGDPNQTVTGKQEYTIDYTMQNVISFYTDHDELYWDVNGTQWSQSFTHVTARLHLPSGLSISRAPLCYAGDAKFPGPCTVKRTGDGLIATADALGPGQTLTFVAAFPSGYFQAPTQADYARQYLIGLLQVVVPIVILGGAGFAWWLLRGRDAKGTGVIIPQYGAPEGLSPLEAGTLYDFKVDNRDLTATIIDLAVRRYLNIVEVDQKILIASTKRYVLKVLNRDWSQLNDWERTLMETFFGPDTAMQDEYDLSQHKSNLDRSVMVQVFKAIKKTVERSLADRGYFVSDPTKYIGTGVGVGIALPFVVVGIVNFSAMGPLLWGIILGFLVFIFFYHFMPARTAKGVAALEYIKGLKLYMEVAEKDRLARLQSPDSPDLIKTAEPEPTVQLFEKLLPYAVALQVEEKWAAKFAAIYTSPPDWYTGNFTAFNAGYLAGSLGSGFSSAIDTNFGVSASSSGSGFGGGGFAGGGGGGGGGGGW